VVISLHLCAAWLLVAVAIESGLRWGELVELRPDDHLPREIVAERSITHGAG
jgi:hypothetical protein